MTKDTFDIVQKKAKNAVFGQEFTEKLKKFASGGEKSLVHDNEKLRGKKMRCRTRPYS